MRQRHSAKSLIVHLLSKRIAAFNGDFPLDHFSRHEFSQLLDFAKAITFTNITNSLALECHWLSIVSIGRSPLVWQLSYGLSPQNFLLRLELKKFQSLPELEI
jgi:hypothetical protein